MRCKEKSNQDKERNRGSCCNGTHSSQDKNAVQWRTKNKISNQTVYINLRKVERNKRLKQKGEDDREKEKRRKEKRAKRGIKR